MLATDHTRTHVRARAHTVEAKQVMSPSQIQPMDLLVCDLGHNGKNIQWAESIEERMIHGTKLRDEDTGKAVKCVPMETKVTTRKAIS